MATSGVVDQPTDQEQALEDLIEEKVEEKVDQQVAKQTADLRQELQAERKRNRMLERALAERDRATDKNRATKSTLYYAVAMIANKLTGADVDFSAEPHEHQDHFEHVGELIDNLENTVARHDSIIEEQGTASGNSKEKKWQDTIEAAENLKNKPDHQIGDGWVKLFTGNIEQATGCSNRRASQLIDEWAEEKRGTELVPYKRLTTSRQTDSSDVQRKALKINLSVWGSN